MMDRISHLSSLKVLYQLNGCFKVSSRNWFSVQSCSKASNYFCDLRERSANKIMALELSEGNREDIYEAAKIHMVAWKENDI